MIENFSKKLALIFTSKNDTDTDDDLTGLIAYGLECIANTIVPLILYLLWGIIRHRLAYVMIWFLVFIMFRNYIGGYHADTHKKCIIFSCLYGLLFIYLIDVCAIFPINVYMTVICFSMVLHIFLKPIIGHKEDESYIYMRKLKISSMLFLIFALASVICIYPYYPLCSTAATLGVVSADILYIAEKFKRI